MKIGYCRVSTGAQDLSLQKDALTAAGCEKVFEDVISGARWERQGLKNMISQLRAGDVVTVWRLDRLGRSLRDLIEIINDLEDRGVGFQSITEHLDTTTSGGKLVFHIFGAMAEFERNLIQERTKAGLSAAKARGRTGGRPPSLDKKSRETLVQLYESKLHTIPELCTMFKISRGTLFRSLTSSPT